MVWSEQEEAAMASQVIAELDRPKEMPFQINKIGHIALYVRNLERSARFYTQVLGFRVSDVYGEDMVPGGAVFLLQHRSPRHSAVQRE
jgi:catechol-2,3-dioxygenase